MTESLQNTIKLMQSGELYDPGDRELLTYQFGCVEKLQRLNALTSSPEDMARRAELIKDMFESVGEHCYIELPFRANWGGRFITLGNGVYINFNFAAVDDAPITIDDYVMVGSNVSIITACHPISPQLRRYGLQYNKPVHIKRGAWISANVTILPGVTIGENSVIGAGSLVTRDIPDNVVAMGVPCKVTRPITDADYKTYDHGKPIPQDFLDRYPMI